MSETVSLHFGYYRLSYGGWGQIAGYIGRVGRGAEPNN
uniref:Uncharacterized protein n=1 Tax=Manihot esculenta TaxID=3983 RepID=A0A2C9VRH3_MANES